MYSTNLEKISLDEFMEVLLTSQLLPSQRIILNKNKTYSDVSLGISDIDYCRRFCEKLDCDIK